MLTFFFLVLIFFLEKRAIAVLSSINDNATIRYQIDQIITDSIDYGILLHEEMSKQRPRVTFQYDVSGMTFPVARAICRYILLRLTLLLVAQQHTEQNKECQEQDLKFITESIGQHRSNSNHRIQEQQHSPTLYMSEYIQYILYNDFHLVSFITNTTSTSKRMNRNTYQYPRGYVTISANVLRKWIVQQETR
jgi:6-pyruvoyl-tetrahydropterin synthase